MYLDINMYEHTHTLFIYFCFIFFLHQNFDLSVLRSSEGEQLISAVQ